MVEALCDPGSEYVGPGFGAFRTVGTIDVWNGAFPDTPRNRIFVLRVFFVHFSPIPIERGPDRIIPRLKKQ